MRLRLQTDFALRVLLYLSYVDRKATVNEIADSFGISREHLVKVVQALARHGYVLTQPGRHGGVTLACDPKTTTVREVVEKIEGRHGVLDCVAAPGSCPMEPGCDLRRLLMFAEEKFYAALATKTLGDLTQGSSSRGGLKNLSIDNPEKPSG
jgi:Rrf2 family nitric oxide-sensitive transcriptional repressor